MSAEHEAENTPDDPDLIFLCNSYMLYLYKAGSHA